MRLLSVAVTLLACWPVHAFAAAADTPAIAEIPGGVSDGDPGEQQTEPGPSPVPAYQWWIFGAIPIELAATDMRTVRATYLGAASSTTQGSVGCTLIQNSPQATGVPADGKVRLVFSGIIRPRGSPYNASRPGDCRLRLRIEKRTLVGSWDSAEEIIYPLVVAPHQQVTIESTATMRDWLKPHKFNEFGCDEFDEGGKIVIRLVAAATGGGCGVSMLTSKNHTRTEGNFMKLPEGVLVNQVTWRVEGSTRQCSLCDSVTSPCRGVQRPPFIVFYEPDSWGVVVRDGRTSGEDHALFTGDPDTPRGGQLISREQIIFGYTDTPRWHSYGLPIHARINCDPWAPTPTETTERVDTARGNFFSRLRNGLREKLGLGSTGKPAEPAGPPSLKVVMEKWEFLRPASRPLPFEG
jgi:hypothetical protein